MKAQIQLAGVGFSTVDVDALLDIYGRFFHIQVPDVKTSDWLAGYALVTGHRISILTADQPSPDNRGTVSVVFPELELPL